MGVREKTPHDSDALVHFKGDYDGSEEKSKEKSSKEKSSEEEVVGKRKPVQPASVVSGPRIAQHPPHPPPHVGISPARSPSMQHGRRTGRSLTLRVED